MIDTKGFKDTMGRIYKAITGEKQVLEQNNLSLQGASEGENIDSLIQRTRGTSFKLLVMGEFSSGKSAFVNVLLGEKLLPEGAVPMTALITEIYYGKAKKVVMYPRPGKWKGGNAPFEIEPTLSEIKKYSTIDNMGGINKKEANRVDSCFEKMVVYWPLDILKDGVTIVDSPGLNDPFCNDYIVKNYVPKADAILFCVNGTKAYSAEDRKTLQMLNSNGFKNPIIVTTYFDVVTMGKGEQEIQEFINICNAKYINHTGKEFCHYVNNVLGMEAKQNQSQSSLVESGYYELERFLTKYLTEKKGKEKIASATSAIKAYNNGQKKSINGVIANLGTPLDEFNQRIAAAGQRLDQARLQGDLLVREFRVKINDIRENVSKKLVPELYQGLCDNVSLDGFEPDVSFTVFHPRESSRQIAEECSKELEMRNKQYVSNWNNDALVPYITKALKDATANMQKQFDAFDADVRSVRITLEPEAAVVDTDVQTGTRAAMVAYALVTGDWMNALMGGVFGAGAFGRAIACQFAAVFIVGIIGLFTPIGLPALVIAGIAGLVAGVGWNAARAADSIKVKTVKEMRNSLLNDREKNIQKAAAECTKIFDQLEARLKQAVDDDVAEVENNIKMIQSERGKNEAQIQARKEQLTKVLAVLDRVDSQMDAVRREHHIA